MSIQANANGAARDLGLYSGIDGVVRKLFKDSELVQDFNVITAAQAGITSKEWFDVNEYSIVVHAITRHYRSGSSMCMFIVFPQFHICLRVYYSFSENSMTDPDWENSITSNEAVISSSYGDFEYDPERNAIKVRNKYLTAFFI